MRVVIDTNVMLAVLSPNPQYSRVYDAFIGRRFIWVVSHEVLLEYEEQLSMRLPVPRAARLIGALLEQPNTLITDIYYRWNLIPNDPDDNKMVDCAVAAGADFLVTNDRHFAVLRPDGFPPVRVITLQGFMQVLGIQQL